MNISGSVKKKALLSSRHSEATWVLFFAVRLSTARLGVKSRSFRHASIHGHFGPSQEKSTSVFNQQQHSPPRPIFRAWQWQSYPKHNGPIRSRADRSCQVLTSEILFAFPFSESVLAAQCCRNLWGLSIDSAWLASAASSLMAKTTSSSIGSIGVLSFSTMGATNISNSDMQ